MRAVVRPDGAVSVVKLSVENAIGFVPGGLRRVGRVEEKRQQVGGVCVNGPGVPPIELGSGA